MSVSIYPVLNKDVLGFDATEMSGKALAAAVYETDNAFAVLQHFSSQNAEWLTDFIADQTGQDPSTIQVPAEEWFTPKAGLEAIRSLTSLVLETGGFADALREDLSNLEKALLLAQQHGALFHLAIDF